MNLSKRLICTLLAIAMILSLFAIYCSADDVTTEYIDETSNQVDIVIAYARAKIGSRAYNGYCQRFVRVCFEAAGIEQDVGVYSAKEASQKWIVSTSRENIPVGAVLYFNATSYGHVGIYLGNNRMIHALHRVVESEISTNFWDLYIGWGWQAGIKPTGTYILQSDILVGDVYRSNEILKLYDEPAGESLMNIAADTALAIESTVERNGEIWGKTRFYSTSGYVRLKYCTYAYTAGGGMTTQSLSSKNVLSAEIVSLPYKYYYVSGEPINTAGLEIEITYSDGTTALTRSAFTLCTPVALGAGRDIVLLSCKGQLIDYTIVVSETGDDLAKFSSRSQSATVDIDYGCLVLTKDVKVSSLSSILRNSSNMKVYSQDGEIKKSGYFATGDYIVYSTSAGAAAVTVVRYGDINGDGSVNSTDKICLGRYRLGLYKLDSRIAKLVTEPVEFVKFQDPCFDDEIIIIFKNIGSLEIK